jgi:hypothetical protein
MDPGEDKPLLDAEVGAAAKPEARPPALTIVHWRPFEVVMGAFLAFGAPTLIIRFGVHKGGTIYIAGSVVVSVLLALFILTRPIRHNFAFQGTTLTVTEYRLLGVPLLPKVRSFVTADLGSLVFDTRRHCCCGYMNYGFMGVYATVGLPREGQPLEIAFQIPLLYHWWHNRLIPGNRECYVAAHKQTFRRLQAALEFTPDPPVCDSVEVTPAKTTLYGGTAEQHFWVNVQNNRRKEDAAAASYENLGCFNPRMITPSSEIRTGIVKGRSVFFVKG